MPIPARPKRARGRSESAAAREVPTRSTRLLALLTLTAAVGLAAAAGRPTPLRPAPPAREAVLQPQSAITFHASDAFGGFDGKAPIASFGLRLDPENLASAQGSLVVKSDAVTTGNFLRDVNAARTVFETSRYPLIRYVITGVESEPPALPDGHSARLTVTGTLDMHGVERREVARGEVSRSGEVLDATLSLPVRLSDFDMTRPRFFTVVVDDVVQVEVHLVLELQAPAGG